MSGALRLASRGAFGSGAGLVFAVAPQETTVAADRRRAGSAVPFPSARRGAERRAPRPRRPGERDRARPGARPGTGQRLLRGGRPAGRPRRRPRCRRARRLPGGAAPSSGGCGGPSPRPHSASWRVPCALPAPGRRRWTSIRGERRRRRPRKAARRCSSRGCRASWHARGRRPAPSPPAIPDSPPAAAGTSWPASAARCSRADSLRSRPPRSPPRRWAARVSLRPVGIRRARCARWTSWPPCRTSGAPGRWSRTSPPRARPPVLLELARPPA